MCDHSPYSLIQDVYTSEHLLAMHAYCKVDSFVEHLKPACPLLARHSIPHV